MKKSLLVASSILIGVVSSTTQAVTAVPTGDVSGGTNVILQQGNNNFTGNVSASGILVPIGSVHLTGISEAHVSTHTDISGNCGSCHVSVNGSDLGNIGVAVSNSPIMGNTAIGPSASNNVTANQTSVTINPPQFHFPR